jgi:hypothetical protein
MPLEPVTHDQVRPRKDHGQLTTDHGRTLHILCILSIYNMRPFADFVNATMSFRAPNLDGRPCPVWRKYFFRNFLPAQWNCCGEGSKRTFLNSHSIAIELPTSGPERPSERATRGQEKSSFNDFSGRIDSVHDARNRTARSRVGCRPL